MSKKTLDRSSAGAVLNSLNEGNLVSGKKVDASIKWIASTGSKMDATIHATAVACIYLSMPHKEGGHNCAMRALALVNAMPKGSRVKALVAWFHAYSNIRFRWEKKAGAYSAGVLKPEAKEYRDARPADALAKPFWSVEEKAVDPAEFTHDKFAAAVAALIKKATAAVDKLSPADKAALDDLRAVGTKLGAKLDA